ncbi:MAG: hypothetical protein COU44_02295, partial [Candidatus Nealsonbacteria bacterium CG10_big_fil_rev_8_21_14_0_10_40_24]
MDGHLAFLIPGRDFGFDVWPIEAEKNAWRSIKKSEEESTLKLARIVVAIVLLALLATPVFAQTVG